MLKYDNGIYDISNDEYHGSEGISRSMLMHFMRTPYHYWYKYVSGLALKEPATKSMNIGSALHTLVLEPNQFNKEFFVLSSKTKPKKGSISFNKIFELAESKIILTPDEYELATNMANAIKKDKFCNSLLSDCAIEQSIFFTHAKTGLQCKIRPDAWSNRLIIDLKTTEDARFIAFQRSAINYGYFLQAGMIFYGMRAIDKPIESFVFIVVEKKTPHAIAIYPLDTDIIDRCIEEFEKQMMSLKKCIDANYWPSYTMLDLTIPKWVNHTYEFIEDEE